MSKINIIVASHKSYKMPSFSIYLLLEVGADIRDEHFFELKDNTGNNISKKNPYYCELTGLYWAYKNLNDYDVLGLVHYRRYFMKNNFCLSKNLKNVITEKQINKILMSKDIILPKKRHYYIETNYSHYIHSHPKEPLDKIRDIIKEFYPNYLSSFDKHMKRRSGHYFNMFIAKKEIIVPFLEWMFDILFKLEKEIDISSYSTYDQRVFGFVSELLFDVYCLKNKLRIKNQKYLFFEKQNWFFKISNFIKRKFKKMD